MTISRLINGRSEIIHGGNGPVPVVLSTRIRLARNVKNHPFPGWAKVAQKCEILSHSNDVLREVPTLKTAAFFNIEDLTDTEKHILVERHLISRELSESSHSSGVLVGRNQACSIMVNEEDHYRIQVLRNGFDLDKAWKAIDTLDTKLEEKLDYAFSEELGYLTACPTNLGTGMRASVMMHLPGLYISNQMEKVIRAVNQLGMVVRGLFGEGSDAIGSFFQISNQTTLGRTEEDLVEDLDRVVRTVIYKELHARQILLRDAGAVTEDKIWRAYGTLRFARTLGFEELMNYLSGVRLGMSLNLLPGLRVYTLNKLMIFTQPAHLDQAAGRDLSPEERDAHRASFVRRVLATEGDVSADADEGAEDRSSDQP